jgi:hypothetical protein
MKELLLRMLIGGTLVSAFAVVGDICKPKRFAGLFGAAPSIALATLALTAARDGKFYAATEALSMIAGALAFLLYSCAVCWTMFRFKSPALRSTLVLIPLWFAVSLSLWFAFLR